ncbi:MAG: branched-chain amino acid ABC transporter permease [Betaproteobacteria bacterium]
MRFDRTVQAFLVAAALLLVAGPFLPKWLAYIGTLSLAYALVVAGTVLLMRAGLVSFGQGLYYCLGGYAAGVAGKYWGITDAFVLLVLAIAVSVAVAALLGLLLARYREIFFAMFTMAFSMILYGLLSKTQALGSTDGFNVAHATFAGFKPATENLQAWLYTLTVALSMACAILVHRYLHSGMGHAGDAIRENEIRVEYLGVSVYRVVYIKYVIAAALGGLGGGLTGLASGHVGPDMAYWTTSGEFVFVALLGGTSHIAASFVASFLFELIKTYALELSPYTWQMVLGVILLGIILFLPKGLWSLVARARRIG